MGRLSLTWAGLPRFGIAGPRADKEAQAPVSGFACASREVEAHGERGICEHAMVLDCAHLDLMRLFAFWGVGVVFEASRGLWTVSWDDDRTQELASGASSTKTRTQFGYPNFVQHPKTLQFQRCDFNV